MRPSRTCWRSTPNDGSEPVTLPNTSTTQGRIKVEAVGNVYFDVSDANLTIQAVADVTHSLVNAVEYSDSFSPDLTVTATDPDTPGSGLSAVATGLPPGMSLQILSTSAGTTLPGTRTWRVAGTAAGPPGLYNVTVNVTDDAGHVTSTAFTIQVTPADARPTYTGDTLVTTRASSAAVTLSANVVDIAALPGPRRRAGRHPQGDGHLPGGLGDPLRAAAGAVVERGQHCGHGILQGDAVAWDTQRPGRGRRPLHRHHDAARRDPAARRLLRAGPTGPALHRTADARQRERAARRRPLPRTSAFASGRPASTGR